MLGHGNPYQEVPGVMLVREEFWSSALTESAERCQLLGTMCLKSQQPRCVTLYGLPLRGWLWFLNTSTFQKYLLLLMLEYLGGKNFQEMTL